MYDLEYKALSDAKLDDTLQFEPCLSVDDSYVDLLYTCTYVTQYYDIT
jgi:hypothetical protein